MPRTIVDMRTRPPLDTWVQKAQFRQGAVYYPTRVGFPRPASAEQRSVDMLVKELDELGQREIDVSGLRVSTAAHLVMPYHLTLDRAEDAAELDV